MFGFSTVHRQWYYLTLRFTNKQKAQKLCVGPMTRQTFNDHHLMHHHIFSPVTCHNLTAIEENWLLSTVSFIFHLKKWRITIKTLQIIQHNVSILWQPKIQMQPHNWEYCTKWLGWSKVHISCLSFLTNIYCTMQSRGCLMSQVVLYVSVHSTIKCSSSGYKSEITFLTSVMMWWAKLCNSRHQMAWACMGFTPSLHQRMCAACRTYTCSPYPATHRKGQKYMYRN